jgi:hypothetical protein
MAAHLVIIFYDPMRQANGHACAAGYANRSYFRRAAERNRPVAAEEVRLVEASAATGPLADIPLHPRMSAFEGKADMTIALRNVRF